MDLFSSSGTRTLNTSQEHALPAAPAGQTNVSRRTTSFQIKKSYEPHIDDDRFREKRVSPIQRRAARRLKAALAIQRLFRGFQVRTWLQRNAAALAVYKRTVEAGRIAVNIRRKERR